MELIKEFTEEYINLSDVSHNNKVKLMDFVNEATEEQLIVLLTTGNISSIEECKNLLKEGGDFVASFLRSLSMHASRISTGGFGEWLKEFPGFVKTSYDMGGAGHAAAAGGAPIIAGAAMATVILLLARKAWKSYGSKANRECAKAPDPKKCKAEFKQKIIKQKISELQKAKGFCSKSKDPKKCVAKLDMEMNKLKQKG